MEDVKTEVTEVKKINAVKGPSLRDKIVAAKTEAEIQTLLAHGKAYSHASDKTRRRWQQAAQTRSAELVKA